MICEKTKFKNDNMQAIYKIACLYCFKDQKNPFLCTICNQHDPDSRIQYAAMRLQLQPINANKSSRGRKKNG